MDIITTGLVLLVAVLHFWFMALEMVFWQKPLGLQTFRMSPEKAATTSVLAANQGLYNGFIAAGLLYALLTSSMTFQIFFLACIIIAGLYGAYSVNRKIFFVQSCPALLALLFILI